MASSPSIGATGRTRPRHASRANALFSGACPEA